jgi:aspartyl-tRNA(Asn)/glutamyl-tRNA(Gln) amidotransferase subunit A
MNAIDDLTDFTVSRALAALRSGELTCTELVRACLERIERLEPRLHTFITLTPELALQQAAAADRQYISGAQARRIYPAVVGHSDRN